MRARNIGHVVRRGIGGTLILAGIGAVLGAVTGIVCLVIVGLPTARTWPANYPILIGLMGSLVGAPLGAVIAPLLGWVVLRRVPPARVLLFAPLGTLIGSLAGIALGSAIDDLNEGVGVIYLVGGAVIGVVLTSLLLRARFGRG